MRRLVRHVLLQWILRRIRDQQPTKPCRTAPWRATTRRRKQFFMIKTLCAKPAWCERIGITWGRKRLATPSPSPQSPFSPGLTSGTSTLKREWPSTTCRSLWHRRSPPCGPAPTSAWRVHVDGFDAEGGSDLTKDGCLDGHVTLPPRPRHGSSSGKERCRRLTLPTLAVAVDISTYQVACSTARGG